MKAKRTLIVTFLALLAMIVGACDTTPTETLPTRENTLPVEPTGIPDRDRPPAAGLEGVNWVLTGYLNGDGEFVKPLPDHEATARFEDGSVSGNTGCNSHFSNYELDGQALTIGAVGMTEMYCFPDELMAQEADFLATLGQVATWGLEGADLQLRDKSGTLLLSFSTREPVPLIGTYWRLTSFYDGQGGVRSVLAGTEITATLSEDGQLSGSAGCNSYFAAVEVSGSTITLSGPVGSTRMACGEPEGIMDQEGAFLTALEKIATYEIEADSLTLFDAGGEPVLSLTAVEPTPLVDMPWKVIGYNNGRGGVTSVLLGTELTATFGADGRVTGSSGITEMFCSEPEGIMDQEAEYLAALSTATTYSIEGDRLQLRDADGALQVDLLRAEAADTE
jgi:heat shock protein HslJ